MKLLLTILAVLLVTSIRVATAFPAVTLTITGPKNVCVGSYPVTLVATSVGHFNHRWSTGQRGTSIRVNGPGSYRVIAEHATGLDTAYFTVSNFPVIKPVIGNPVEYICKGDVASLQAPAGFTRYRWNTGDTTSAIFISVPGKYALNAVDINGCPSVSDTIQLIVVDKPRPILKGVATVCKGSITIADVTSYPGARYEWKVLGGSVVKGANTNAVQIEWQRSGRVDVKVTVPRPDGGTCDTTVGMVVRAISTTPPSLAVSSRDICSGETSILTVPTGYLYYRWSTGARGTSITVTDAGRYWCEVYDTAGCQGFTDTVTINVHQQPDISIAGPFEICSGQGAVLQATDTRSIAMQWVWNTGESGPSIQIDKAGTYRVIGRTLYGCTDTAEFTVASVERASIAAPNQIVFPLMQAGTGNRQNVRISNLGTTALSITGARLLRNNPMISISAPSWPRIVTAGASANIALECDASLIGPFVDTLEITFNSSVCPGAAMYIPVSGNVAAVIEPQTEIVEWQVATIDTTVDVGQSLNLPVHIVGRTQSGNPGSLSDIKLMITWNHNLWVLRDVENAQIISHNVVGSQHRLVVSKKNVPVPCDDIIVLHGTTYLDRHYYTPVSIEELRVVSPDSSTTATSDGSIRLTNCFITGRLVSFSTDSLDSRVAVPVMLYDVQGRVVAQSVQVPVIDTLQWIPGSVPSGMYHVVYITSSKTYATQIVISH